MCNVCMICGENKATKTNSHIVPSFLMFFFTSYNGSGKRDTEVMFTLTNSKDSVYTGRSVSDTKIDQLFDKSKLTEERIQKELSKNMVAKDFVFCPQCEKRPSDFLESPYALYSKEGKLVDDDIPLSFWLSVIWRMSVTKDYGFDLGEALNENLRLYLKSYFDVKEKSFDVTETVKTVPFRYKLLRCKDYCKSENGFLFAQYKDGVLDVVLGEYILRVFFKLYGEFLNSPFMGAETYFVGSSVNHGTNVEQAVDLDIETLKKFVGEFVKYAAYLKRKNVEAKLDLIWKRLELPDAMPNQLKELFFENYYNEDVKIGGRHEEKRFAEVLTPILANYFGVK